MLTVAAAWELEPTAPGSLEGASEEGVRYPEVLKVGRGDRTAEGTAASTAPRRSRTSCQA